MGINISRRTSSLREISREYIEYADKLDKLSKDKQSLMQEIFHETHEWHKKIEEQHPIMSNISKVLERTMPRVSNAGEKFLFLFYIDLEYMINMKLYMLNQAETSVLRLDNIRSCICEEYGTNVISKYIDVEPTQSGIMDITNTDTETNLRMYCVIEARHGAVIFGWYYARTRKLATYRIISFDGTLLYTNNYSYTPFDDIIMN